MLSSAFSTLHQLKGMTTVNIALAEGVTVDHRGFYHVSLVCELLDSTSSDSEREPNPELVARRKESLQNMANKIKAALSKVGFEGWYSDEPQVTPEPALRWVRWVQNARIETGLIRGVEWHSEIRRLAATDADADQYDFARAVVSCNTRQRLVRFVFPKKGAVSIKVQHADTPGALAELTQTLGDNLRLNILSSILRRGGAKEVGNSVLIAVCEPTAQSTDAQNALKQVEQLGVNLPDNIKKNLLDPFTSLRKRIDTELGAIPPRFRAKWTVSKGRRWMDSLYLKHPDDIGVRVPSSLKAAVEQVVREEVEPGCIPVFLSRRFAGANAHTDRLLEKIRSTLSKNDCQAIEATPTAGTEHPTIQQVESRLWACKMGIVLVTALQDTDSLSMNLAHEYGFISGQGKPVVFLVESSERDKISRLISNLQGIVVEEFAGGEDALDNHLPNSIVSRLEQWLPRARAAMKPRL